MGCVQEIWEGFDGGLKDYDDSTRGDTMEYVVGWWAGETQRHTVCKDRETAEERRTALKAQSAAHLYVSLEPVRMMPRGVFHKMQEMLRANVWNGRCAHSTYKRLCVTCVGKEVQ